MRIAICEDEILIAEQIAETIRNYFHNLKMDITLSVFTDATTFEQSGFAYDLVFLDYKLPDKSGIELAHNIRRVSAKVVIVFISAYSEYVFESFEVGTFRYLLKPIKEEEINQTLSSFLSLKQKGVPVELPQKKKTLFINLDEILYIESAEKHCIVRVYDEVYETTKSLSAIQAEIDDNSFFRTHRRYLVNMRYITEVEKGIITMTNGEKVEISRRNLANFNKSYMNFLKYSD